jgi:hypothetical protein
MVSSQIAAPNPLAQWQPGQQSPLYTGDHKSPIEEKSSQQTT